MSKILQAMKKSSAGTSDLAKRLASIDHLKLFPPPQVSQQADFEKLVNSLIRMHDGMGGLVVVFSAASSGEGNSFVSYNVALQLHAMMDRKVAWIDGNFLSPQPKLVNEEHNFRNLLQDPGLWKGFPVSNTVTMIPNGSRRIKPTDLLKSENYSRVLQAFQEEFYVTIIDAPPFLESVDVAHLAAKAFGLVVVVESRGLKYEVIRHGIDNLASHGVDMLGAVLNKRAYEIPELIYKRL